MNEKAKLTVLKGNRRNHSRLGLDHFSVDCQCIIEDEIVLSSSIRTLDFGCIELEFKHDSELENLKINTGLSFKLSRSNQIFFDAKWMITAIRKTNDKILLIIEHPERKRIDPFKGYFSYESLWKDYRYRFVSMDNVHEYTTELGKHFTELKHATEKPFVKISLGKTIITTNFDFSSNQANLEFLDFTINNQVETISEAQDIWIEYHHFCARYVFKSRVRSVDVEFGLLIVELPNELFICTDRRFYRWDCSVECEVDFGGEKKIRGAINNVAASGLSFASDDSELLSMLSVGMSCQAVVSTDVKFECRVTNIGSHRIGLQFTDPQRTSEQIGFLLAQIARGGKEIRSKEKYQDYLDLYVDIGYGPKTDSEKESWKRKTIEIWEQVDSILPGNSVGLRKDGKIVTSFGVIPISNTCVYGHSLAMQKNESSIKVLFDLLAISMWWVEFLPGIEFYVGAARHSSKFTTRLFTSFQMSPVVKSYIVKTLKLKFKWDDVECHSQGLTLRPLDCKRSIYPGSKAS